MHSNAVCFGNTFYDPGDRFPFIQQCIQQLFVENDRREGICSAMWKTVGFVGEWFR